MISARWASCIMVAVGALTSACNTSGEHQPVAAAPVASAESGKLRMQLGGSAVTYLGQVKPIFEKRCASCHNSGSTVPNWLDYDTAVLKRSAIFQRVVIERTMPAAPFNSSMSDEERGLVAAWVKTGTPKGEIAAAPLPPAPMTPAPQHPAGPGPLPRTCSDRQGPALLVAAKAGDTDAVDRLLTQGACADFKDEKGRTVLVAVLSEADISQQTAAFSHVVSSLLAAKADPNMVYDGGSALAWALFNDYGDLVQQLVEKGADTGLRVTKGSDDALGSVLGYTPLMMAVQNGNADSVNALLANGADPLVKSEDGTTAARLAAQISDLNRKAVIVQLLETFMKEGPLNAPSFSRQVRAVFERRCQMCHNQASPAMNWLDYEVAYKKRALIYVRAVGLKDMPMNENVTKITDEERAMLGRWVQTGALK